ncbi:uncharacterized protein MELLADRAFT_84243 [Melampsora larici-populina 98AG31]|uniref:Uncharacterized protein n=1 Tax=Melampsora larici-populina (strain 98AG31 / pathotype 3-4-7) TaxID=747676 RepID=F4RF09_MELLP|nr:uncharacterized protein MELLADRAFT_84243 [Melampsora larici-populina 98AG31]EGG08737.1 hypothetical protein MELLADRAFT_84243 [Melampsora larici-populina 98AG31]
MLFEELEQQLLFNSLGGMLAGGMTASWIAGMAIVEGLRAVQDLWLYPSIAFKTYITGLVALSMGITGLFGVTLYHHLIKFFGDYDSVDRIYPLLRYHFVLCRVCVVLNHMQFSYGAFKVISRMRGLYLPLILMIVVGVLVLGSGLASGIAVYNFFQQTSYSVVQTKLGIWQAMFFMEFACHLGLTAMRAVYMYKANDIKAVITHAGHPIRYVADICLLVARTPTYNTIFALITMCVLDGGTFGTRYFLVFGGSQLALVAMVSLKQVTENSL